MSPGQKPVKQSHSGARLAGIMTTDSKRPDPEVPAKAARRTFPAEFKRRILASADQLEADGVAVGAMLRKEGLYRSQLSDWRKARDEHGDAGMAGQKRGRKAVPGGTAAKLDVRQRDRRIARLERELAQARFIIDFQKKVSEMMALSASLDDESAS
jgi:transposase-like protein